MKNLWYRMQFFFLYKILKRGTILHSIDPSDGADTTAVATFWHHKNELYLVNIKNNVDG